MNGHTTRFGLLRHAITEWNLQKRIQGQKDSPLAPGGYRQAQKWGETLKKHSWNRLISSDLGRAVETAEIINAALKIPVTSDARLREQDWGLWAGKGLQQVRREASRLLSQEEASGWRFRPPGGEDRRSVWTRSREVLEEAAQKWPGERILLICHEGVIKCVVNALCGRRFLPTEPQILWRQHLHWLVHDASGLRVERLNSVKLTE
jgi:probable phosphoglycerate mutase